MRIDALIFDMDGVLVDVSESYRDATRETVRLYLQAGLGLPPRGGDWVSRDQVAAFKLAGGFNNDWDLTAAILMYFLAALEAPSPAPFQPNSPAEGMDSLRQAGLHARFSRDASAPSGDLDAFADRVASAGGGLAAVRQILRGRNGHLLFASGELHKTNLVKRIFEEAYLGEEEFRAEYGEDAIVVHGAGLCRRERLMASKSGLETLSQRTRLGIATGRPRRQALAALERFEIAKLFQSLVTLEDVAAEEARRRQATGEIAHLGKPNPYALLEAARRIDPGLRTAAYVGDTPDDVRAANAAKAEIDYRSIGCLASARDPEKLRRELERVGADLIVDHPDELLEKLK